MMPRIIEGHSRSSAHKERDCRAVWQSKDVIPTEVVDNVIQYGLLEHECGRMKQHEPPHRCVICSNECW